jgi:2,3-bisphosphoglycerate-independent phosphoglycerate mutase
MKEQQVPGESDQGGGASPRPAGSGPLVLVVLDGWGLREEREENAIAHARTPNMSHWWRTCPHTQVETSGLHVGLPDGQMGNSEVGHMNLGAGRVIYQDYTRINRAIADGSFMRNPVLCDAMRAVMSSGGTLHVMGLLSSGGVHSHIDHLLAAVQMATDWGIGRIAVHGFLDGRDTPPRSALGELDLFESGLRRMGTPARVVSLVGRYYAMDRDKRWDRVQLAYDMLTLGTGNVAETAREAVLAAYGRGEDDEFVQPTWIVPGMTLADGDAVVMMNFRADRMREICHALLDPAGVDASVMPLVRQKIPALSAFVCLTLYDEALDGVAVAFPPVRLARLLGEELSHHGLRQLRAAETEKYAHVTYFFNGGQELPFPGEERLLIPSPRVATYDEQPAMSAQALTDAVVERIDTGTYDVVVVNYANADMVGHTGRFPAAVAAIEAVDAQLGRIVAAVRRHGGEVLITADHGNAEQMRDEAGQPHTAHTHNPVPLVYIGDRELAWVAREQHVARLCDIAPSMLALLGMAQPEEMEGVSLLAGGVGDG